MDATTVVAIVGAVTGSVSLLIQFLSWRSERTNIKLRVNPGTAPMLSGETDPYGNELDSPQEAVIMDIRNRSAHPIKISHIGAYKPSLRRRKQSMLIARPYPLQRPLPLDIAARDNHLVWFKRDPMDAGVLRFQVGTTDGRTFKTRPLKVDKRPELEFAHL